jgi:UDP-glucose 4-epimerase
VRVLLTGRAGFIGSHVADRLLTHGHKVVVADLSTGTSRTFLRKPIFVWRTSAPDAPTLRRFSLEALYHHAAQIDVRRPFREPDFDADFNIFGIIRLLQSCTTYITAQTTEWVG